MEQKKRLSKVQEEIVKEMREGGSFMFFWSNSTYYLKTVILQSYVAINRRTASKLRAVGVIEKYDTIRDIDHYRLTEYGKTIKLAYY